MPGQNSKATVLIVEDETLVRIHGADILEEAGFFVLEASDAEQALVMLCQHDDIHLLFPDIDMPGYMDGLALAHMVHVRWPRIQLLLTSGYHQLQTAIIPGDGKFMPKPWIEEILIRKIHEMLGA